MHAQQHDDKSQSMHAVRNRGVKRAKFTNFFLFLSLAASGHLADIVLVELEVVVYQMF